MKEEIEKFKEFLISKEACSEAKDWAEGKTLKEIWNTCHRGDWMLWLYRRAKNYDFRTITLAKGHCANTVRHLMKDSRSIKAVDSAIQFGEGNLTESELADAAVAAYVAYSYTAAAYTYAAAAAYSAYAAAATYADDAVATAYADRKKNQQLTADICRKHLPIPII